MAVFQERLDMGNNLLESIRTEGEVQYPNEACGLVVKFGKKKSVAIACKNTAEDKRNNFIIDINDYVVACDVGEVIGVWHTHVEEPSTPSQADIVGCSNSGMPWYIVSVYKRDGAFVFSDLEKLTPNDFEMPYLERPYVSGVFDCFSLVRDFYKREYGVEISDYPRTEADGTPGYTFFASRYEKEGFESVCGSEPVKGDLFIMQIGSHESNHLAIYLGNGMMLHHSAQRLSREEIYGGMYLKHTTHHLRLKGK
jgi:proteasome lid subunit RPN8/RPN11